MLQNVQKSNGPHSMRQQVSTGPRGKPGALFPAVGGDIQAPARFRPLPVSTPGSREVSHPSGERERGLGKKIKARALLLLLLIALVS